MYGVCQQNNMNSKDYSLQKENNFFVPIFHVKNLVFSNICVNTHTHTHTHTHTYRLARSLQFYFIRTASSVFYFKMRNLFFYTMQF